MSLAQLARRVHEFFRLTTGVFEANNVAGVLGVQTRRALDILYVFLGIGLVDLRRDDARTQWRGDHNLVRELAIHYHRRHESIAESKGEAMTITTRTRELVRQFFASKVRDLASKRVSGVVA